MRMCVKTRDAKTLFTVGDHTQLPPKRVRLRYHRLVDCALKCEDFIPPTNSPQRTYQVAPLQYREGYGVVDQKSAHDKRQQAQGGEIEVEGLRKLAY